MNVIVNGEPQETDDNVSLADFLRRMSLHDRPVAVEVNRELITRANHDDHILQEGDQLEVVTLVGGG